MFGLWGSVVVQRRAAGGVGGPAGVRAPDGVGVAQTPVAVPPARLCGVVCGWARVSDRAAAGVVDRTRRAVDDTTSWRGAAVGDSAAALGCGRRTVNASVQRWGQALLDADAKGVSAVSALGLDETLFCRRGGFNERGWSTSIVGVGRGRLLDVVPGRAAEAPARWLSARPASWRAGVRWAALDLSGPYRAAFEAALPHPRRVADPFHVARLADNALDETRRRAQNQTLGHRGREHDPLYRARKLLLPGCERVTEPGEVELLGLLDAGDPRGEARDAWHAKETLRGVYGIANPEQGAATVEQLAVEFQDPSLPVEINRLGRTLWRWRTQTADWHSARVTNAATEPADNLIKRVLRKLGGSGGCGCPRLSVGDPPESALLRQPKPEDPCGTRPYVHVRVVGRTRRSRDCWR